MNDQNDNEAAGKAAATPAKPPVPAAAGETRKRHGVGGIWILIAVAALGVALWQWIETRGRLNVTQHELAARLAAQDGRLTDAIAAAKEARESGEAAKARLAVVEARLGEFQSQYATLNAMYQDVARGRDESVIADVEQLIGLAAQQLQFAGNASGAVLALSQADGRLAKIDRAQLANVRRLIARDIERLRALPEVDLVAISVKIETVVESIDALAVAHAMRPAVQAPTQPPAVAEEQSTDPWQRARRFGRELWGELTGLIRIQRFDRLEPALLPPAQEYFLRENLKLRLLNARLALLSRDGNTFRHEIRQARAWVERHFDTRQRAAEAAMATLEQLAALDIVLRLPRLDETLAAVRAVQLDHQRSAR